MAMQTAQQFCNTKIDYSQVVGQTIFPFFIELDLATSKLNPDPGENQRFCYKVTGVGTDDPSFTDLSHLVLGICNQIPQNQITNITVTLNGQSQVIDFSDEGNVQLRTPLNPDPPTGCTGLKFDFEVDKTDGEMFFCFELTTTYPVGSNLVCLFGGNFTASELSICGPVCFETETCEAVGYQPATVCVPVTVTPFAIAGTPITFCCGDAIVNPGTQICPGVINGSCSFTLTQNICVAVPVEFGATTNVGATYVNCKEATNKDICTDCNGSTTEAFPGQCAGCKQK